MTLNSQHDLEERTRQITLALQGLKFPAEKPEILSCARTNHLHPDSLSSLVTGLPERQYYDLRDVLTHLSGDTDITEGEYENASTPSF